jgi:hypothetical protein
MLTHATQPLRDRAGRSTTPEQLRVSGAAPLSDGSFRLQNLEDVRLDFSAESVTGYRVQVKGALVRRQTDVRIDVTAIDTLAASCP